MKFVHLIIIVTAMLTGIPRVAAQEIAVADSCDSSTRFSARQLIVPGTLIALGALGTIDSHNGVNKEVDSWFHGAPRTYADDYLRFVPSAAYVGLGWCGVKSRHSTRDRLLVAATSHVVMAGLSYGLKYTVHETRPDGSDRHAFPSGHVALAFTGAELMRIEYGNAWGAAGYAVAGTVAVLRLHNRQHWLHDVCMGAGIGLLSAHAGYWLLPWEKKIFKINDRHRGTYIAALPSYDWQSRATTLSLVAQF